MIFIEVTDSDNLKHMINISAIDYIAKERDGTVSIKLNNYTKPWNYKESYDQLKSKLKTYGYFLDISEDKCK